MIVLQNSQILWLVSRSGKIVNYPVSSCVAQNRIISPLTITGNQPARLIELPVQWEQLSKVKTMKSGSRDNQQRIEAGFPDTIDSYSEISYADAELVGRRG